MIDRKFSVTQWWQSLQAFTHRVIICLLTTAQQILRCWSLMVECTLTLMLATIISIWQVCCLGRCWFIICRCIKVDKLFVNMINVTSLICYYYFLAIRYYLFLICLFWIRCHTLNWLVIAWILPWMLNLLLVVQTLMWYFWLFVFTI